jgi:hypothetical protein
MIRHDINKDEAIVWTVKQLIAGNTGAMFLREAAMKHFDKHVCVNTIRNWIVEAKQELKGMRYGEIEEELDLHLSRLEGLYNMNLKIQDFEGARKVLSDRAKILGLEKSDVLKTEANLLTLRFANLDVKKPIEIVDVINPNEKHAR